ncbi:hypothetical protein [Gemmatimonas sp.]|uniref:hypothetical protein n=1 Tax=Gemmatimonas sp. TaxID=1962908 RepID=UPI0037BF3C81
MIDVRDNAEVADVTEFQRNALLEGAMRGQPFKIIDSGGNLVPGCENGGRHERAAAV